MEKNSIVYSVGVIVLGYFSGTIAGDLKALVDELRIKYPKAFIPGNFVFPIVWTILYYFYGFFLYKIWSANRSNTLKFLSVFGLVINLLWTVLFFKNRFLSFLVIIVQIITAALTIYNLDNVDDSFIILYQLCYIVWLTFASILNYQVL